MQHESKCNVRQLKLKSNSSENDEKEPFSWFSISILQKWNYMFFSQQSLQNEEKSTWRNQIKPQSERGWLPSKHTEFYLAVGHHRGWNRLAFYSISPMLLAFFINNCMRGSRSFSTLLSSTASFKVCFNWPTSRQGPRWNISIISLPSMQGCRSRL